MSPDPDPDLRTWTLKELSEETGIEPRTIRSWIEHGLLPEAGGRGRGSHYSRRHLERVRCIQALRDAAPLRLQQIRGILQGLDEDRVRAIASGREPVLALELGLRAGAIWAGAGLLAEPPEGSAAEYIRSVRRRGAGPPRVQAMPLPAPVGQESPLDGLVKAVRRGAGKPKVRRRSRTQWWASIPITPDLELRARGYADEDLRRLERVADYIAHILRGTEPIEQGGKDHDG